MPLKSPKRPKSVTTISSLLTAIPIRSRQFHFTHGNFILLTAISFYSRQFQFVQGNFNLFPAISIYSRQFQLYLRQFQLYSRQFHFTHGIFNLFMAISICSRQFQFAHGNFNFLTANNAHGIFRFAHHVKTQNQKSIFKVDLQSEK